MVTLRRTKGAPLTHDEMDANFREIAEKVSSVNPATSGVWTHTGLAQISGGVMGTGPAGIGYGLGSGGTVIQPTSKSTAVTLNKPCGQITMHPEQMLPGAEVSFFVLNNTVGDGDLPAVSHNSAFFVIGMPYSLSVTYVAAGFFVISLKNMSAVSRSEVLVINFTIIKGSAS